MPFRMSLSPVAVSAARYYKEPGRRVIRTFLTHASAQTAAGSVSDERCRASAPTANRRRDQKGGHEQRSAAVARAFVIALSPRRRDATEGRHARLGRLAEPNCAHWYAACRNSSWGRDMMGFQTVPRAFDFIDDQYRPSPLLAGEPTLDTSPRQRATYQLNPQACGPTGSRSRRATFAIQRRWPRRRP